MKLRFFFPPALIACALTISPANARLLLTEIQSDGAASYWELTNTGNHSISLANFKWNDNAQTVTNAIVIPAGSSIAPGESVIFTGIAAADFHTLWGIPDSVKVFTAPSVPGLDQNDGVSFYDASDTEVFFFSYGMGGFTRSNGSPAHGGHAGISAGGATGQAMIWAPQSGTVAPTYTNATGSNLNTVSAPGSVTSKGSPGYSGYVPTVDLNAYVRVGRYNLPEPTRTALPSGTPIHNVLCQEASGVTYNWDTDTLFIIGDGGKSITQVSTTGILIDTMTLALGVGPQGTDFYDPEGITYIGGGQFVFTEERDRQLVKCTYAAGTTLSRGDTQMVKLGTFVDNIGTEGVTYDPQTGGFVCLKEISPIGIFQTNVDFALGTATNGSSTTTNSTDLFDPAFLGMTDVADVFAFSNFPALTGQPQVGNLLVLSQENARIVNIDRAGIIQSTLNLATDTGNPLSIGAQQHEGLTMDRSGNLYIVSENGGGDIDHPQLWVYSPSMTPNQAPNAVVVDNALNSIEENTATTSPIKLGDIAVTDDGLGLNSLSLSGADASSFEINGTSLFLKAGTILDFEAKASYQAVVHVDDSTVGTTPDAFVNFTLSVIDQTTEVLPPPALVISEVAPWASTVANSPLAADWFEVTNVSSKTVNIENWKVDDNSSSFANAVALSGITEIAAGESVIFIETSDLVGKSALFRSNWFGGNPPAGLQIGNYSGASIGLSSGGDAVNLFSASGTLQAAVTFGASPSTAPFATFDNTVGANDRAITALSTVGSNGAIVAANSPNEIGSPGFSAPGNLVVTEVAPWSSGNSPVAADWFEVTNTGGRAVDLNGWKVDDSSESFVAAVALTGVSSIAPGESVVFVETANLTNTRTLFRNTWLGVDSASTLQIGGYSGGSIGLSSGGDAVNLYDGGGIRRANVSFDASSTSVPFATFDNAAGLNVAALTLKSVPGINGAFTAANDVNELGSPGVAVMAGPLDFGLWLAAKGYSSRGFGADTDRDGLTDGLEYYFNQNPNRGEHSGHTPQITTNNGTSVLNFTRLTNTGSVTAKMMVSTDLNRWTPAILGLDYTVASSVANGAETAVSYALQGVGPSVPSPSPSYVTPNTSGPVTAGAALGGVRVVNEGLVGVGRLTGESLDKFGETQGASSGLSISDWAWTAGEFSGKFNVLPDRGYGDGSSNYAARLHKVGFTFTPYYGLGPVPQNQVSMAYLDSTKFTYQDGEKMKFTSGLNPTGISQLFGGQTVGTVTAANGQGGAQESLLSFDAEAVHLFEDGSGFVADEYGAYIARFNSAKQITGITQLPEAARPHRPRTTLNFDSTAAPTNGRRNNQGLEGMSVTPDGTRLFAMLQSATVQDTNGSQQQTRNNARLFVYDIVGVSRENLVLVGEYVVKLPQIDLNADGSGADGTAAQSEIVALSSTSFLMLPRDGNGLGKLNSTPILFKSVQLVDFASASNILGQYDAVEQQISPAGSLLPEIKTATTAEIINMLQQDDLRKFGLNTTIPANANTLNEKIEGMSLVPDLSTPVANDFFLFVANDNDFQSSDVKMLDAAGNFRTNPQGGPIDGRLTPGVTNDAMMYVWRLTIDVGDKKFFRFEVK